MPLSKRQKKESSGSASPNKNKNPESILQLAEKLLAQYESESSCTLLYEALEKYQRTLELVLFSGCSKGLLLKIYKGQGKASYLIEAFGHSLVCYEKILELDPTDRFARLVAGQIYKILGNSRKALEYLSHITALVENNQEESSETNLAWITALAYFHQAEMNRSFSKFSEAIPYYDKALHHNPVHVESLWKEGVCYAELKKYEEALNNFEKALKIQPDNKFSLKYKSKVLYMQIGLLLKDNPSLTSSELLEYENINNEPNPASSYSSITDSFSHHPGNANNIIQLFSK